jgi:hypothetical protein
MLFHTAGMRLFFLMLMIVVCDGDAFDDAMVSTTVLQHKQTHFLQQTEFCHDAGKCIHYFGSASSKHIEACCDEPYAAARHYTFPAAPIERRRSATDGSVGCGWGR